MALTLNTNIDSLIAQNNLSGSQALLSQSLTRLSSGLRINSAADDAAGLAIAQQFSTQINGTNQAINNANDAVSEAQTAGRRARPRSSTTCRASAPSRSKRPTARTAPSDRAALDAQVQQQIAEITQIALADHLQRRERAERHAAARPTYQVGANVGDTIAINLAQGVRRQSDRSDRDLDRHRGHRRLR